MNKKGVLRIGHNPDSVLRMWAYYRQVGLSIPQRDRSGLLLVQES